MCDRSGGLKNQRACPNRGGKNCSVRGKSATFGRSLHCARKGCSVRVTILNADLLTCCSSCIGSAFNAKKKMECPSCRNVEDGEWLCPKNSLEDSGLGFNFDFNDVNLFDFEELLLQFEAPIISSVGSLLSLVPYDPIGIDIFSQPHQHYNYNDMRSDGMSENIQAQTRNSGFQARSSIGFSETARAPRLMQNTSQGFANDRSDHRPVFPRNFNNTLLPGSSSRFDSQIHQNNTNFRVHDSNFSQDFHSDSLPRYTGPVNSRPHHGPFSTSVNHFAGPFARHQHADPLIPFVERRQRMSRDTVLVAGHNNSTSELGDTLTQSRHRVTALSRNSTTTDPYISQMTNTYHPDTNAGFSHRRYFND